MELSRVFVFAVIFLFGASYVKTPPRTNSKKEDDYPKIPFSSKEKNRKNDPFWPKWPVDDLLLFRVRRELESMREQKKREREQIREQVKKRNKKKRERKRERKNEQKNKYGMAPVNRDPVVSEMLSDFVFGNSQNSEIEENFDEGNDNEEARSR